MRKAVRAIILKDDAILVMHRNKFGKEYDILIGGGVEIGEPPETALLREIAEETGVAVTQPRLVYVERAGAPYGDQLIFLCRYVSGEPVLDKSTTEYQINQMGQNTYAPVWRSFAELETTEFRSPPLKQAILNGLKHGFPNQPIDITNT